MILEYAEECPYCTCDGDEHDSTGCTIHPSCPHTFEDNDEDAFYDDDLYDDFEDPDDDYDDDDF